MRHAKRVSGLSHLSLNCLDVLTGLKTIKIAKAYKLNGKIIYNYPASLHEIEQCKPIYDELPGWNEDITHIKDFSDLPLNAQNYVKKISELVGVNLATFSVGPDRMQTHVLVDIWHELDNKS